MEWSVARRRSSLARCTTAQSRPVRSVPLASREVQLDALRAARARFDRELSELPPTSMCMVSADRTGRPSPRALGQADYYDVKVWAKLDGTYELTNYAQKAAGQ